MIFMIIYERKEVYDEANFSKDEIEFFYNIFYKYEHESLPAIKKKVEELVQKY